MDEDGQLLTARLGPAVSEEQLRERERAMGVRFPDELRQLLALGDGGSVFGCHIMGIDEQMHFPDHAILTFHDWGNGDFDCVAMNGSRYPVGVILFMNHSPHVLVQIAASLAQWLVAVTEEIAEKGAVLHPSDYRVRTESGLYRHVLDELRNVDCELNR